MNSLFFVYFEVLIRSDDLYSVSNMFELNFKTIRIKKALLDFSPEFFENGDMSFKNRR